MKTDWQSLCFELADNLSAIAPLVYNIASDDEEEAESAYYLSNLVKRAFEALENAQTD